MTSLEDIDDKGRQGLLIAAIAWLVAMLAFFLADGRYTTALKTIIFLCVIAAFYGSITYWISLIKTKKKNRM
jgi:hypothetical protein